MSGLLIRVLAFIVWGVSAVGCRPDFDEQLPDLEDVDVQDNRDPRLELQPAPPRYENEVIPPLEEQEDCTNLILEDNSVLQCDLIYADALSFCENVAPECNEYGSCDPNTDWDSFIVSTCGNCDAQYFSPPAVAECSPTNTTCQPKCFQAPVPGVEVAGYDSSCVACHAPNGYDQPGSTEHPHPWGPVTTEFPENEQLTCVTCHGGNPQGYCVEEPCLTFSSTPSEVRAHIPAPVSVGGVLEQQSDPIKKFRRTTLEGLDLGDPETRDWLQFVAPSDMRIVKQGRSCGQCHAASAIGNGLPGGNVVAKVDASIMATNAGILSGLFYAIGMEHGNGGLSGATSTSANAWLSEADTGAREVNQSIASNGNVGQVDALSSITNLEEDTSGWPSSSQWSTSEASSGDAQWPGGLSHGANASEAMLKAGLTQACGNCHIHNAHENNTPGFYRATGCAACHYETGLLGLSESGDPNIAKDGNGFPKLELETGEQSHIRSHRVLSKAKTVSIDGFTTSIRGIPDNNCRACHSESGQTVPQYQGWRIDNSGALSRSEHYPSQQPLIAYREKTNFIEDANPSLYRKRPEERLIETEVWQHDIQNAGFGSGQDETPADIHHERGLGCIDCHGVESMHGSGQIYSRMSQSMHFNDVKCMDCHGTIDRPACTDNAGNEVACVNSGGNLMEHMARRSTDGALILKSKIDGRDHFVPELVDIVNPDSVRTYPAESTERVGEPLYNRVASYAMGRFQSGSNDRRDGFGPVQNISSTLNQNQFSHTDSMACASCHSAWQNNRLGRNLVIDADLSSNDLSYTTGEPINFKVSSLDDVDSYLSQNPIEFYLGLDHLGRIAPVQSMHIALGYSDISTPSASSTWKVFGDRNGLGNDPALRNASRHSRPALTYLSISPHTIRGKATRTHVGVRGCLDCHKAKTSNVTLSSKEDSTSWDFTSIAQAYGDATEMNVRMIRGLGNGLWCLDAMGQRVECTNALARYELDRLVESDGTSNTSFLDPRLDVGAPSDPDLNGTSMARPLNASLLNRLQSIDTTGLSDIYYDVLGADDPLASKSHLYFMNDYCFEGQSTCN